MANTEKIVWTVLPNGFISSGGTNYLKLTVAVSPRLYGSGNQLSDWSNFTDWPSTLQSVAFNFLFDGGSSATITGVPDPTPNLPTADSTIWKYLFQKTTLVTPYAYQDWSPRFIQTNPASEVYALLKGQYQEIVALYPSAMPPGTILRRFMEKIFPDGTFYTLSDYQSYLKEAHGGGKKTFPKPSSPAEAMLQSQLFYHRGGGYPDGRSDHDGWNYTPPYPTTGQALDFHQQVSSLGKYWELLRVLGLAVDLVVPFDQVPSGDGSVRLVTPLLGTSGDITPQTMYTRTASNLQIASSSGALKNGYLDLTSTNFTLAQVNIDGSAIKFAGWVRQLNSSSDADNQYASRTGIEPAHPLPAMRSGGLGLFEQGRASDLASYLPTAASNNSTAEGGGGSSLQFHAEDLLQGYRIDIWDSHSAAWHSLHARTAALDPADDPSSTNPAMLPGSYQFLLAPNGSQYYQPVFPDEGFVSMGMTSDPNGPMNGGPGPDVYLHELVSRWMGWSLSAQRPNMFVSDDQTDSPTSYDASDSSDGSGVQMLTHFGAAPGSLPRLRFGRGYRIRARSVDLTGNSLPATDTTTNYELPAPADDPLVYRRFEPVITPAVVLHDPVAATPSPQPPGVTPGEATGSPGESVHRLVIRSSYDHVHNKPVTADEELAFLTGLGYTSLPPVTTRWIVPPRMSALMAEHHGLLDQGSGWRPDALTLMTSYDQSLAAADGQPDVVYGDPGSANPFPDPLPYLPDILSAGASFLGLPGTGGNVFGPKGTLPTASDSLSFTGTWPDFEPFRLTVAGLNKGVPAKKPVWDSANRILTVYVEQAAWVQDPVSKGWFLPTANLSSFLTVQGLELMGIFGWLAEYEKAGKIKQAELLAIAELAVFGLCWALTPGQDITFVNATQLPLVRPKFQKLQSQRQTLGATDALLQAPPMKIDGDSTIKVDVYATWIDPRDDLSLDPCPQPDFPDPSDPSKTLPGLPKELVNTAHVVEIPLLPGQTKIDLAPHENYTHKFGDTKHHNVVYSATATTRFLEYFPSDPSVPTTVTSPEAHCNVYSSARPQSPNILYSVPAFGWDNKTSGKTTTSLREGGLLRVYLDRPFYSSGPDELLGVVMINSAAQADVITSSRAKRALAAHGLARHDSSGVTTVLEKYVTQWGMDPLWVSPTIQNPPMVADFPTATHTATDLYLEELGGKKGKIPVSVAGFPVTYDDDRCVYFCDIPFDWGNSYYPFVRLALATYQPYSLSAPDTVHLSRVIVNEFVQLAPHRLAEVKTHASPKLPKRVELSVIGVSTGSPKKPGTYMEVTVEQQAPQIGTSSDELAWVPVPNLDIVLTPEAVPKTDYTAWLGIFDLPHPVGSVPFRLIIREYELYPGEWGQYTPPTPPSSKKSSARKDDVAVAPKVKRLVYAATLQI